MKQQLDAVLRERLGSAIRSSLAEQKVLGGFDPDQFAESVKTRISSEVHHRMADAIREYLHELDDDGLRQAIRQVVTQRGEYTPSYSGYSGFGGYSGYNSNLD